MDWSGLRFAVSHVLAIGVVLGGTPSAQAKLRPESDAIKLAPSELIDRRLQDYRELRVDDLRSVQELGEIVLNGPGSRARSSSRRANVLVSQARAPRPICSGTLTSVINLGEAYYRLVRVGRSDEAETLWRMALRGTLPVSVKDATRRRVRRAAS
jgi:hypothetical protein